MHFKTIFISFVLLLFALTCNAQKSLDSLLTILRQPDFSKIYKANDSIINYQEAAVPKLIELLNDTSFVKLVNTFDLIYPGATKFYGHGWVINYDLDYVNVRAAWLLEQIVFRDFGYESIPMSEDSLLKIHQKDYLEFLENGFHDIDLKDKGPRTELTAYRLFLASNVKKWWVKNGKNWSRFRGIKDALVSNDVRREIAAIKYLRDCVQSRRHTKCNNLTTERFHKELYPLIRQIRAKNNDAKGEADFFLIYEKDPQFK